jgi:hypothetical protein
LIFIKKYYIIFIANKKRIKDSHSNIFGIDC